MAGYKTIQKNQSFSYVSAIKKNHDTYFSFVGSWEIYWKRTCCYNLQATITIASQSQKYLAINELCGVRGGVCSGVLAFCQESCSGLLIDLLIQSSQESTRDLHLQREQGESETQKQETVKGSSGRQTEPWCQLVHRISNFKSMSLSKPQVPTTSHNNIVLAKVFYLRESGQKRFFQKLRKDYFTYCFLVFFFLI